MILPLASGSIAHLFVVYHGMDWMLRRLLRMRQVMIATMISVTEPLQRDCSRSMLRRLRATTSCLRCHNTRRS